MILVWRSGTSLDACLCELVFTFIDLVVDAFGHLLVLVLYMLYAAFTCNLALAPSLDLVSAMTLAKQAQHYLRAGVSLIMAPFWRSGAGSRSPRPLSQLSPTSCLRWSLRTWVSLVCSSECIGALGRQLSCLSASL